MICSVLTAEHFRTELWFPKLLDCTFYQAWLDAGAVGREARCRERKEHLLATHEVEPVPKDLGQAQPFRPALTLIRCAVIDGSKQWRQT